MKTQLRLLCLCLAVLCTGAVSKAQISGAITVPSTVYPTLKAAIDTLNLRGMSGSVTVNFTSATNEVAPVGGYRLGSAVLNASANAGTTLTINGNGNNLTAYAGTSTTADGVFYIMGTDYVTINNLNLIESVANTTDTTQMEWGYSLVKLSGAAPFDGCQNDQINGCVITLTGNYINTIGIRSAHSIAGTSFVLTNSGATVFSTNSYNRFTGNTINGVTRGIRLIGINTLAYYDKRNEIGGTTPGSGNTITIGGTTNACYSVWTQFDSVITVQHNTFAVAATQNGAFFHYLPANGVGDLTVINNTFNMNCAMASVNAYAYYNNGTHSDTGAGLSAASTHTITGNMITGNNPLAVSSSFYGIYEYAAYCKVLNVTNNKIQNINWNTSSGTMYLLYTYYNYSPYININSNNIYNISKLSTAGLIYAFYCYQTLSPTGLYNHQYNTVRKIRSNYSVYNYVFGSQTQPPTGYTGQALKYKYNVIDSIDFTASPSAICSLFNYAYNGMDSTEISYNQVTNIQGPPSGSLYLNNYAYGYYAPNAYKQVGNLISNVSAFNLYNNNYLGYYGNFSDSNTISNFNCTGTAGSIYNYMGMYAAPGRTTGAPPIISNNRVNNITTNGAFLYNYVGYSIPDVEVKYNAFTNINLRGAGYFYNVIGSNGSSNARVHHNRVDSITQATSNTFNPFYVIASGTVQKIHDNVVSNLTTNATGITFYPFYLLASGTTTETQFYNNTLSNINFPATYTGTSSAGIYLATTALYKLYNNTVRTGAPFTGASGSGFTGIYYLNNTLLDLRNNIINVNISPNGGYVAALRRNTGTTGAPPANFLSTSNGNIYYAPNVSNSWLYAEGVSASAMINAYNLTNDTAFNTPCGRFKTFMGHNKASFTENNLVAGALPGTYVPTGTSYAEKGGVSTSSPAVTTDYAGVTRGPVVDMGALEFSGTSIDNAPPIISLAPVPLQSYCSNLPTLVATITDNSGVNNAPGSAPRLYYKKSTDTNAFVTNGWRYVEPTTISGSTYTFNFDYTLLSSPVAPCDSITYFIIAQDNATPVNAGTSGVGFPLCPSSVALGSGHGPVNAFPVPNGFKILCTPTFKAVGIPTQACFSGSSVITITPFPIGATVQWQVATLTGAFSNITGATNTSYTTPVDTTTFRYRALIYCGSSLLTTTAIDTFTIVKPDVISTTGATRCGYGSVVLSATVTPNSIAKWYTTATGGTAFYSGNSYATPPLSSTTTYYVSASTPNVGTEIASKLPAAAYTYSYGNGYGLEMNFRNAATNFYSTTVYPWNASGTFTVELWNSLGFPVTGYASGPFVVSGGNGSTPVVLPLNWQNIPAGRYFLVMNSVSGSPNLNMEVMPTGTYNFPFISPSSNVTIISGRYATGNYYAYFYDNLFGTDCESSASGGGGGGMARKPVTATVTPAPGITVSSPGSPGICLGTCTMIGVSSPNTSYIYNWIPGSMTGVSHTVCPTVTTTYYVTATDPFTGCVGFDSVNLAVNPVPAPPTITPVNPSVCAGSAVVLTGSAVVGTPAVGTVGTGSLVNTITSFPTPYGQYYGSDHEQYLITAAELTAAGVTPGILTSIGFYQTAAYIGAPMKDYTVRIAATAATAITGLLAPPTHTFTQVFYAPSYTPGPTVGWVTLGFGAPFTWNGTSNIVVDISFLNCSVCNTTASCTTSFTNNGTVMQTIMPFLAAYFVYDDNNCTIPSFTPTGSYTTGNTFQRPNMRFGYRKPSSISWLNVTGLWKNAALTTAVSLTDTSTTVYAAPAVTTAYQAITNIQGCKSAPSLPDTVFVLPAPVVTVTPAGPQSVCSGQTGILCIPAGPNQSYQWFLNNVAIAGANTNCYAAGAAGSYKVTATNIITGCPATSIPTVITINPSPVVTATAGGLTTFCNGDSVALSAGSTTAIAWQWLVSGIPIPGATGSTYMAKTTGSYTVEGINSFGCKSPSNIIAVTVNTTPSTVTPQSSTSFCTGDSVVLQGPIGSSLTYQWYTSSGTISGATSSSYTATSSGSYYAVVTNTSTGCSATSAPILVTVGPGGPSSVINPSGLVNGCLGGTVTLSAVSYPGLCYQWNLNGAPIVGATSATYAAATNGNYTVTVRICATPACNSTTASPAAVTINALPAATVTPTSVPAFCQGGSATLSANTGTGLNYQWSLNGTPIAGATASTVSATSNGNYTVTVTSAATGCSRVSNAVVVTVNPLPVVAITPASATTFCLGGNVVLNATSITGASYVWRINGVSQPGNGSTFTANVTGLYTVTVTNSNGCSDTSAATSVLVNPVPNVATIPTGAAAICQGDTITLTIPSGPALSYQWYIGASLIVGAASNTYTTGTAGTYKVAVTNTTTGCTATSANIVLTVNMPPNATATAAGSTTICQGDSLQLTATTGTGLVYQWKFNGNDIVGATGGIYYAKLAGRYTVAVSNAATCTMLSNPIVITANPRPAAFITYNTPLAFCAGDSVVLIANPGTGLIYQWMMNGLPTDTSTNYVVTASGLYSLDVTNSFGCTSGSGALNVVVHPTPVPAVTLRNSTTLQAGAGYLNYQWYFNNVFIGGANADTLSFSGNGAYTVWVVDTNGCEGFSAPFFINGVGIIGTASGKGIRIYPNPTSGMLHIDAGVRLKVSLYDAAGKKVLEATDVKEIDLGDVSNGMYLLYISDMEGHLLRTEKVSKVNR